MGIKSEIYKVLFSITYSFSTLTASGQQINLKQENFLSDFVFKGNHIQLNFASLSIFKARLKNQSGNHPVSTRPAMGLLLNFKYQKNFNNYYSLITGPEIIIEGRNLITAFKKDDFSPPLVRDYEIKGAASYSADLIISLPVLMEKRWLYAKTKFLFTNSGVRINVSTGADFDIFSILLMNTNNSYYDVGGVDVYANNDANPWISFPINVGHAWMLKNNNLLELAFCSNISFSKYVNGTYQINVPGKPPTLGNYSSAGSYIGLSLNYVFTNANYRIRKEYEKRGRKL